VINHSVQRNEGVANLGSRVLEISSLARIIRHLVGEPEMKTAIKSLVGVYAAVGIITLLIQLYWRYPVCSEAMGCGLSFAKGVVWSAIWPFYWWIMLPAVL
jgi:hypothetical protein